jgi:hypothetical protein
MMDMRTPIDCSTRRSTANHTSGPHLCAQCVPEIWNCSEQSNHSWRMNEMPVDFSKRRHWN